MKSKLAFIIPCTLIIFALIGVLIYASIDKNTVTEGNFSYSLNEDETEYSVAAAKDAEFEAEMVIPSSFNGKPVTSIRPEGFASEVGFSTVKIPASVTEIGYEAFKECKALKTVEFEDSARVESIGNAVFSDCRALEAIKLPDGIKYLSYNLFYGCESLKTAELPEGITEISDGAFSYCISLSEISIPVSVKEIGNNSFFNCLKLASVEFGNEENGSSLRRIGRNAFYSCNAITNLTFPEKIKNIDSAAFAYCRGLEFVSFTGSSLSEIGASAFIGCTALGGVEVADIANWCSVSFSGNDYANPIYLGQRLFSGGELVLRLEIPHGVKRISARAFKNATRIVSVTFPRDFDYEDGAIGTDAFRYCYKLAEIHNFSKLQISTSSAELVKFGYIGAYVKKVFYWDAADYPLTGGLYPYGAAGTIYSEDEYTDYATNIYTCGDDNEFIFYKSSTEHYFLEYLGSDSEIALPELSTKYGIFTGAFFGQDGISSVVLPSCVNEIWHFAFYSSNDLKRIYIPSGVTSMGDRLFGKTTDLDIYFEVSGHLVGWKDTYKDSADGVQIHYSSRKEALPWVMEILNK